MLSMFIFFCPHLHSKRLDLTKGFITKTYDYYKLKKKKVRLLPKFRGKLTSSTGQMHPSDVPKLKRLIFFFL